ncbi:predicted protein [Histoplasma capsulatum var. duboisii H88]|uniref:Predicted protein n=1 Tax=Ajellomyces capsulatus (strain H88) TaxID=544711 RepID=F0UT71_AJEC8|nr:predicted protein [Histoplasma capsulatum var. duboisii H88]QSS54697.1 hypothetical protein I7I53_02338 [Histoplasma capsulatum var. duboisii H88]
MQRPDGNFARSGVPSLTESMGRSENEMMEVDMRLSGSLLDKRPLSRGRLIQNAGGNISQDELSKYSPPSSTAASKLANCGNTLELLKLLDGQHEPMHRSAPFQIVVKLVASGNKRLRLNDNNEPKPRSKHEVVDSDDPHGQTEKPRSRIWNSMSTTKRRRPWKGDSESQRNETVRHDHQVGSPQRRKWMVSGTRNRKNSKVVECENRDFLYPGVAKLPSLPLENKQAEAVNYKSCNGQSPVASPCSQEPRSLEDVFWQPEKALDNLNGVERLKDFTGAALAAGLNNLGEEPSSLALSDSGTKGTTPTTWEGRIAATGDSGVTNLPENYNRNNHKSNDTHCQNQRPLQQHACTEETTASGSPSIRAHPSPLQARNCFPASNNTSPAPQLPRVPPDLTPELTASKGTKAKKPLTCPPPDTTHINLQCLPPRSSSKGACRNASLFTAFTDHRRRSSHSKSPLLPHSSSDTQSLISLFPRPARFPHASHFAASMSSVEQIQPLHTVPTSTPNHIGTEKSKGYRRSVSRGSLLASPPHRETSPDMANLKAVVSTPFPQITDNSQYPPAQAKTTNLQDHYILTTPGENQCTGGNAGRSLSPRGSLESKKLRCLGIPDPSKMDTTKPLDKMSRAERVFVLRMRDMCLARESLKKDHQQCIPSEGSTSQEIRRDWELQTQSKKARGKPTDMPTTPSKVYRNDAPGAPPSIPLPADPPVPSLRSSSNKIVLNPNQPTLQSLSTISLDAALAHKFDARLSASSSGSTHRSDSNNSWSSRSAHSGNDISKQKHATNLEQHTFSSQRDGPREEIAIAFDPRPLTPLPPPMSDEAHTGISPNCGNCVSCPHLRANPSPTNKNRQNTFFYKENRSEPRPNNAPVSQSPLRECFPRDSSRPYSPSLQHFSNTNTYSNRTGAGAGASASNNTHTTSSPQPPSTRPRSQEIPMHPQCEARIAFLERQNKMLQAALIAALDVGVTFDADLMRTVTSTPVSIASPGSETKNKNVFRHSYTSTSTTGTTSTTTSAQRLSMDGRRSYVSDNSVESATNVVRWRSVRDAHPCDD